jgi:signal transduction histidine kinase/ActR/RegA family two-component response regulator
MRQPTEAARSGCARLPPGHRHDLPDPRRAEDERLRAEIEVASRHPVVDAMLSAIDASLVVLNEQRQIVAYSRGAAALVDRDEVLGLRPGEAFGCVNAQSSAGCGAARACATCGALGVILAARAQDRSVETDWMMNRVTADLELSVRATPVILEGRAFTVLSLRDVSAERRRESLEQIFFHDVLNTITGLRGWAEVLRAAAGANPEAAERVALLSQHIEREIRDHKSVVLAERGELRPNPEHLRVSQLLQDLHGMFSSRFEFCGRRLTVDAAPALELDADPTLLLRVLVNMLKNALEASEPGGTVHVRCDALSAESRAQRAGVAGIRFSVHNDGVMPAEVQERIFQRSFSTKAPHGRGLGTYSMKLLGERYLHGKVSFVSNEQVGTTFSLDLPLRAAAPSGASGRHGGELVPSGPSAARPPRDPGSDRIVRRRVLLIDDDRDVREALGEYLRTRLGHEVELAEDGAAAIARARLWKPELVFCDIGLQGIDGYEVARRFRAEPGLRRSVLVAMTGYAGRGGEGRASEAGFDHQCTKPLDLDALESFLHLVSATASER